MGENRGTFRLLKTTAGATHWHNAAHWEPCGKVCGCRGRSSSAPQRNRSPERASGWCSLTLCSECQASLSKRESVWDRLESEADRKCNTTNFSDRDRENALLLCVTALWRTSWSLSNTTRSMNSEQVSVPKSKEVTTTFLVAPECHFVSTICQHSTTSLSCSNYEAATTPICSKGVSLKKKKARYLTATSS